MKKIIVLFSFLLACLPGLWADTFTFKFTKGDQYRIITKLEESVLYDGELSHNAEILDKIALKVNDVSDAAGHFTALFQVSQQLDSVLGIYVLSEEQTSTYTVDRQGRFTIDPAVLFPFTVQCARFPDPGPASGRRLEPAG